MVDQLEKLLLGGDEEPIAEVCAEKNLFSKLYICRPALEKAQLYARLIKDETGKHTECIGYCITGENNKNRLIEDIYFAPDQINGSADTKLEAEAVIKAGREIRAMKKRVLGWWHSHADFSPFHSGTDDENIETVLDQIGSGNYSRIYTEINLLGDEIKKVKLDESSLAIGDRSNLSKRLEITFDDNYKNPLIGIPLKKVVLRMPQKVGFAYSLVVNARGDTPFGKIATAKYCFNCANYECELKEVPVRVVNYDPGIEINEAKIRADIKNKMKSNIYLPRKFKKISEKNTTKSKFFDIIFPWNQ